MKIEVGFLSTKVARRILLLFLLSAVIPTTALSVFSYSSVRNHLLTEARGHLSDASKNAANALVERFQLLEGTARLIAVPSAWGTDGPGTPDPEGNLAPEGPDGLLGGLVAWTDGRTRSLFGSIPPPPAPGPDEWEHLRSGAALVLVHGTDGPSPLLYLGILHDIGLPGERVLWALIDPVFLLRTATAYASLAAEGAGLCVLYEGSRPIFCTLEDQADLIDAYRSRAEEPRSPRTLEGSALFEWASAGQGPHLAASRIVFLRPQFQVSGISVVVTEPEASALATLQGFRDLFWRVLLMGLVFVALLSNFQIRRSLDPLAELKKGTDRLAAGEFGGKVAVSSKDEFGDLANSFNHMSSELEAQFRALATIGEIDRAILSALDSDEIIQTALEKTGDLLPCDQAAVCRLDWLGAREGKIQVFDVPSAVAGKPLKVLLSDDDLSMFPEGTEHRTFEGQEAAQYFGERLGGETVSGAALVPLRHPEGMAGFFGVGRRSTAPFSEAELSRIQQIGKQISIALGNAWLLEELERMGWGALTALARTIDAKSPWTSGHSEQVAMLSVAIGRRLELPETTITALQRGGLVHDIGKIAVPGSILDKNGKLTPDEREVVESHPEAGVRILEPVPGMDPILPMVLYHHESWDGSGYPSGLSGEAIPLEARIMAVADQFDALSSDRPYRAGLSLDRTVDYLKSQAGVGLDPKLVEVFLDLLSSGELPLSMEAYSEAET